MNDQKLIDIMFSISIASAEYWGKQEKYEVEKHMEWVVDQLRMCGFDTEPCGMSWGVLK